MAGGGGSSPRVRGTPFCALSNGMAPRFIPACAGNATRPPLFVFNRPVHPRVCGERTKRRILPNKSCGSSPRVRGTRIHADAGAHRIRFIPACAGNARSSSWMPFRKNGSSPRVRGTLILPLLSSRRRRFIPACAGNARPVMRSRPHIPVHPRVCGERVICAPIWSGWAGSSPRVRGTPRPYTDARAGRRFIPACAGNASRPAAARKWGAVHPRVCGERLWAIARCAWAPRFIPACAGNA